MKTIGWVSCLALLWACGDDSSAGSESAGSGGATSQAGDGEPPAAGDGGEAGGDDAPADVSFARDVAPVFAAKCNYCHHPDNAVKVDLTRPFDPDVGIIGRENSWTEAPSTLLVDPGNPDNSFLLDKVRRSDLEPHLEGFPMPWTIERLTDDELGAVRQWIGDGANDDAFYRDNVAPIFGDGASLGSRGGKCGYCHYPGTPQPPDLTNPFDPVDGVVGVMSGAEMRVAPGDPDASLLIRKLEGTLGAQMPFWPPPLGDAEIDAIERWIVAGAPDN